MPVPNLTGIQDWRYRIPAELLKRQDPNADLIQALMGAGQSIDKYNSAKSADPFAAYKEGLIPAQSTQPAPNVPQIDARAKQLGLPVQSSPQGEVINAPASNTQGFIQSQYQPQGQGYAPKPVADPMALFKAKEDYKRENKKTGEEWDNDTINSWASRLIAKNAEGQHTFVPQWLDRMFGIGGKNVKNVDKILSKAQELDPTFDAQAVKREYMASTNVSIQKLNANFETVQNEVSKLESLNKSLPRTAVPLLNKAYLAASRFFGGGDATEFQSAVELFKDSLSTILANGTMTDARLYIAQSALSPDMSEENFQRVLDNVVQVFVDYRKGAVGNIQGKNTTATGTTGGGLSASGFADWKKKKGLK